MTEFTGERVIPGQVGDDLWAEHVARYAFAARFAAGKRVLDVGCGVGYGSAELAVTAREVTGVDVAAEAVAYAAENYSRPIFLEASAEKLPFEAGSFDLITAFELIEHLDNWRAMLGEARRVLAPAGVLIVSTPNKLYYGEARGGAGPNPYHRHEFEYAEFGEALKDFFPEVRVLLQDRMESFGFYGAAGTGKAEGSIARAAGSVEAANFFVALCSRQALPEDGAFLYVPRAANLLRERETHISKLTDELRQVRVWLEGMTAERDEMIVRHAQMEGHLKEKNQWAEGLDAMLKATQARVVEVQEEFMAEQEQAKKAISWLEAAMASEQARARETIAALEGRSAAQQGSALDTIIRLEATLAEEQARAHQAFVRLEATLADEQASAMQAITGLEAAFADEQARAMQAITGLEAAFADEQASAMQAITGLEAIVAERTEWAQDLDRQVQSLSAELMVATDRAAELAGTLAFVRQSRWLKAGRVVGLGPKL